MFLRGGVKGVKEVKRAFAIIAGKMSSNSPLLLRAADQRRACAARAACPCPTMTLATNAAARQQSQPPQSWQREQEDVQSRLVELNLKTPHEALEKVQQG